MYSRRASGVPSKSEQEGALRETDVGSERLERWSTRPLAGDDQADFRERPQLCDRLDEHFERLLRPQERHGADHRRGGRDPELLPDVATTLGQRRDAVRDQADETFGHPLDRVGEPADDVAIEGAADPIALERPRVFVRDDDRHARRSPHQSTPDVRAELVRVQDVNALSPKQAPESQPRQRRERSSTLERQHADARGSRGGFCRGRGGARRAQDHVEALSVEPRRLLERKALRAADARHRVDQDEDLQARRRPSRPRRRRSGFARHGRHYCD
jgi:hypothetical protein